MHTVVTRGDRRVRALAVACAVLLLFGLVGAATVRSSSGEEGRLVAAASATTRTGSARVAVEVVVQVAGNKVTMKGEGLADFGAERASVTMDDPGGGGKMRVVTDGATAYLQGPLYQQVAQGKPWVAIDTAEFGGQAMSGGGAGGGDVLSSLRALEDSGVVRHVREVGVDEVRGVRTVHYRGEYDPDALLRKMSGGSDRMRSLLQSTRLGSASVEVWVGDDDLVRRMTTTLSMATSGVTADTSTTVDLFDFGIPVQIDIPPPDQVHRITLPA